MIIKIIIVTIGLIIMTIIIIIIFYLKSSFIDGENVPESFLFE